MRAQIRIDHRDLPPDAAVTALDAVEALSALFEIRIEVVCGDADLDLQALLDSTCSVHLTSDAGDERAFHGVVDEADFLGSRQSVHLDRLWSYRLVLRPSLFGLTYRVRTRIFQELGAIEIVKDVLAGGGVPAGDTRWDTNADPPARTYCAQWKESELNFVLRLLEDEGIFFGFDHTEIDHTLWFADDSSVFRAIDGEPVLQVLGANDLRAEGVWDLSLDTTLVHDAVRARDFFFETPDAPLTSEAGDQGLRLNYEYPGGFLTNDEGARRGPIRLDEAWSEQAVLRGNTNSVRMAPGRTFDIAGGAPEAFIDQFTVRRVQHHFRAEVGANHDQSRYGDYQNTIVAAPSDIPFRPPRITPKPVANGLESAVVTGPPGEEIHVDEFGRINVHFYWDRENPVDDTASCWIRVQQLNTQGAMILPRVGWEMHVAFENGDPDRPFAIHKAYNAETMPPYGLPANKTQASLQSSTSPGGGSTNELRLQDSSAGMEWFLHASKDLNVNVANDENETVGIDSSEAVTGTMSTSVGGDEAGSIGADQAVSVAGDYSTEITGAQTVSIGANDDWGITGNLGFGTAGDRTETIGGLMNVLANKISESVGGNLTRSVGAVQAILSATAIAETIGGSKTETVSAAKAIITPGEVSETISGVKNLTSGAVTMKTGGDVSYGAKGAVAVTAAAAIKISAGGDAIFTGHRVQVTAGTASIKGGGNTFKLSGSITIDAKKFGGKGGPMLTLKGKTDYEAG
ncbi:MAG TPA: type VI secretion system tip protein VgrG [Polyangiaceae bacterium]|nr:type VI secretion system tip protein VgrG [Polyangiaceae bacterium]